MSDAAIQRRRSFILRLKRPPAEGDPLTGWCGTLELTPFEADAVPLKGGFNDLTELPALIVELLAKRNRRAIQ